MTAKGCGCSIVAHSTMGNPSHFIMGPKIVYCPLHENAWKMEKIIRLYRVSLQDWDPVAKELDNFLASIEGKE